MPFKPATCHTDSSGYCGKQSRARAAIPSYFVVMCDYPAQRAREAVVNPEHTRGAIVDLLRRGEWEDVLFVHEIVPGDVVRDVTDELLHEAGLEDARLADAGMADDTTGMAGGITLDMTALVIRTTGDEDNRSDIDDIHRVARLRALAGVA